MTYRIVTWNINSVRLRLPLLLRLIAELDPTVICLQELKAATELFPAEAIASAGYPHQAVIGQPGYNGVAIVSRLPLGTASIVGFCDRPEEARHIAAPLEIDGGSVMLETLYIPAGGDEPDPSVNPRFAHKLAFLDELRGFAAAQARRRGTILVGDFNVAPLEQDVWSHRQMQSVVSHTPAEIDRLTAAQSAGGFVDALRQIVPASDKLYSWWSYRARDWAASDRGRRLDHIWLSADLAPRLVGGGVLRAARGWEQPSDHVPVWVDLA